MALKEIYGDQGKGRGRWLKSDFMSDEFLEMRKKWLDDTRAWNASKPVWEDWVAEHGGQEQEDGGQEQEDGEEAGQ